MGDCATLGNDRRCLATVQPMEPIAHFGGFFQCWHGLGEIHGTMPPAATRRHSGRNRWNTNQTRLALPALPVYVWQLCRIHNVRRLAQGWDNLILCIAQRPAVGPCIPSGVDSRSWLLWYSYVAS